DVERLDPLLAALGGGPRAIVNDAFAAMRAGTRAPHGCVSVAGTGAVSAGRNREGRIFRTMGNGLGEGRGASSLVHEALDAVARRLDMLEEPFELVRSGGVALAGSGALDEAFLAVVREQAPLATVTPLMVPPVAGAALLALDLLDAGTPDAHDELALEVLQ